MKNKFILIVVLITFFLAPSIYADNISKHNLGDFGDRIEIGLKVDTITWKLVPIKSKFYHSIPNSQINSEKVNKKEKTEIENWFFTCLLKFSFTAIGIVIVFLIVIFLQFIFRVFFVLYCNFSLKSFKKFCH